MHSFKGEAKDGLSYIKKSSKIDLQYKGGRRGRDRMVVGFTTTYEITFNNISVFSWRAVLLVNDIDI
jgi:hypothetical protein